MNCATRNSFVYALFTLLAASLVAAQTTAPSDQSSSGQTSLGDYARKMHKDPSAKVQPKVFDNDNLPTNDKLSIVGEATTASNANGSDSSSTEGGAKPPNPADAKDSNAAKPAASPEDQQVKKQAEWKSWQDKLASQKRHRSCFPRTGRGAEGIPTASGGNVWGRGESAAQFSSVG